MLLEVVITCALRPSIKVIWRTTDDKGDVSLKAPLLEILNIAVDLPCLG